MILSLLAISIFSFGARAAETIPAAAPAVAAPNCQSLGNSVRGDFSLEKDTAAGKVFICGLGSTEKLAADAYLVRDGRLVAIPGNEFGTLGGLADAYGPFDTSWVSLKETKDGFEVTELLPYEKDHSLPAFRHAVHCRKDGCRAEKTSCVFKRPKGRVDKSALRRLKKDWKDPGLAEKMAAVSESIQQELAAAAGAAKPEEATKKSPAAAGDAFQDDIMIVYRNALLGHKPSRELLLDENKMVKVEAGREDHTDGAPHVMVNAALGRLRKAGCLR